MELIDTHCHLNDPRFESDLPEVIQRARSAGVTELVNIGYDLDSSRKGIELAALYSGLKTTVGIHPHDADTADEAALAELAKLAGAESVAAIGEIGLDYYYDNSPRELQRLAFRRQMELAKEMDLPVVIHSRSAAQETLEILQEFAPLRGIMHCFSGSFETAQICMDLGLYIAFGGAITFKNADRLRGVAARVPLERTVLETDCPYLSPEPWRGRRNEPAYLVSVLAKLAELKQVSEAEAARITTVNARNVFGLE
ncbi:MAG: TatD family hydrolase [Firmicutes bacterium]|jgi:TatD DNase family protein|nr:TatD family hydrolase [Bacillota bacterium]